MLVSKLIWKALLYTHTDEDDFDPETLWLDAYNNVRNQVLNKMVWVKDDYFWDRWLSDWVDWQSEYVSQFLGSDEEENKVLIKKIEKLFVKYDTDSTYYTPVRYLSTSAMVEEPDYYSENQSTLDPFFNVKDQSIFIYPAFTEAVPAWLKYNLIYMPAELWYDDEDDKIDEDKQSIIELWIRELIYESQGKMNEASASKARFDSQLNTFIWEIKARYNKPVTKSYNANNFR